METKTCCQCGIEKPISNFRFINRKNRKGYFDSYCSECHKETMKTYKSRKYNPNRKYKYHAPTEKSRKSNREYQRRRKERDINFRLACNIRSLINASLIGKRTLDVLGCGYADFIKYIEKQFTDGMTWENHSKYGWHFDHKIPLSWFDLTKPEEFSKANHYTNFQPLWAEDNLHKGNRWFDK